MQKTKITFWGVRGSLPAPGINTAKYGGNTPCLEINHNNTLIICDAGSGIRALGDDLVKKRKLKDIRTTILTSHIHLDHIMGLPFFKPLYIKGSKINFISAILPAGKLEKKIVDIFAPPYFPIKITDVPARLTFKSFKTASIAGIKIDTFICNHPGGAAAYQFRLPGGKRLVHITDNEPARNREKELIKWIRGADILIHDAQYSPKQYNHRKLGWGHSPYTYPIELASKAGIKKLFLFHFDPAATDKYLDKVKAEARRYAKKMGAGVEVDMAVEKRTIFV